MHKKSLVFENSFWEVLISLESLQKKTPLHHFLEELNCTHDKFLEVCSFLKSLNLNIRTSEDSGACLIHPIDKGHKLQFELSFSEWLALQAHYLKINESAQEAYSNVWDDCFERLTQEYPEVCLERAIRDEEQLGTALSHLRTQHQKFIAQIEATLNDHSILEVKIGGEGKVFDLYTHKLVYLDGHLSLVGEDCSDRCLVYFNLNEVTNLVDRGSHDYRPNFSMVEVHDFIFAIRAVSGNEERLVLKILNREGVDLNPSYHFLGNPYVTSNMENEMIWAASVEVSESLYEWLFDMRDCLEILDPAELKEDFQKYVSMREGSYIKKAS